jgi:chemotaxis protein histidine kinase CheA
VADRVGQMPAVEAHHAEPEETRGHPALMERAGDPPSGGASVGLTSASAAASRTASSVDVGLLDRLMNLTGELVRAESDCPARRGAGSADDRVCAAPVARHERVWEAVTMTRMQPTGTSG